MIDRYVAILDVARSRHQLSGLTRVLRVDLYALASLTPAILGNEY